MSKCKCSSTASHKDLVSKKVFWKRKLKSVPQSFRSHIHWFTKISLKSVVDVKTVTTLSVLISFAISVQKSEINYILILV